MSGAEFIAVAGVLSSMIAIIDGIKQVVEATLDAEGLPKVFRRASHKLPIISDILKAARTALERKDAPEVERSIKQMIDDCQENWQKLKGLFDTVVPDEKSDRLDRYYRAVKTLGKGGKVETLMKEILESVQLLASFKVLTAARQEEVVEMDMVKEKLAQEITDVEGWEQSVPDNVFEEGGYTMTVSGSGHCIAQGEGVIQNNLKDNSRQVTVSGGSYYERTPAGNLI
ncbi:hypothetical protein DRE_07730 [Drechslerella stenobrocha 248]|uniref:NACHT-NTPase and P-loop NTPases N-terminal domain-containing protein n=1 Tax=Drechslerella stenobrocha 248 TaxID=1043628 RepID=W7IH12_9PEZI|nr:hypothetical protein DRE_07730 [Drechslerella stenobrocha 248]